jgi:hypothetical protein
MTVMLVCLAHDDTAGYSLAAEITDAAARRGASATLLTSPDAVSQVLEVLARHGGTDAASPYSQSEQDEVSRRLEALGYLG